MYHAFHTEILFLSKNMFSVEIRLCRELFFQRKCLDQTIAGGFESSIFPLNVIACDDYIDTFNIRETFINLMIVSHCLFHIAHGCPFIKHSINDLRIGQ